MSSSAAPRLESFIGGKFEPAGGPFHDDINPSDRSDVIARVPAGAPEDAARAARAAENAFESWRERPGPQRADALGRWADAIHARRDEMASAMSREVGKPITEARGEVARCTTHPPLLRGRRGPRVRRRHPRAVARRAAIHASRAARRRRARHSLELPSRDPALEGGSRARVRQHGRPEAGGSVLEGRLAARRDRARGRAPRRRLQRAARLRSGRRQGAPLGTRRPRRELHRFRERSARVSPPPRRRATSAIKPRWAEKTS